MNESTKKVIRIVNNWFIQWADDVAARDRYSLECAGRAVDIATELRNLLTTLSNSLGFEYDELIVELLHDLDTDIIVGYKDAIQILLK